MNDSDVPLFSGYEIHTQGDAFEVAFATAVSAVQFCLWTQDQLKCAEWPKLVLRVPEFAESRDENEDVVMRGPRVRMGVHAAAPGTWQKGTHGTGTHTLSRAMKRLTGGAGSLVVEHLTRNTGRSFVSVYKSTSTCTLRLAVFFCAS